MCGIAGWYNLEAKEVNSRKDLLRMLNQISYRGPDSMGAYVHDHVYMGNVRLSIIDIEGGGQPPRQLVMKMDLYTQYIMEKYITIVS